MKTIGVIPLIDYGRNSYRMIPGYLKGLQTAGALPIILPVIERGREIQTVSYNESIAKTVSALLS